MFIMYDVQFGTHFSVNGHVDVKSQNYWYILISIKLCMYVEHISEADEDKEKSWHLRHPKQLCLHLLQAWFWFAVRVGSCSWFTSRPWLRCRLSRSPKAPWHHDLQPLLALHLSRSLLCRYWNRWTITHRHTQKMGFINGTNGVKHGICFFLV